MSVSHVTYYDFDHCRQFLESRARELRETASGLESLALFRELFYSFSHEALDQGAMTLGQFDASIVYLFIPQTLSQGDYHSGHNVARAKALELLNCAPSEPPLVFELLSTQSHEPALSPRGRLETWARPDFLQDVLIPGRVQIHLYFDGGCFFRDFLVPQVEQRGFTPADDYVHSARSGELRVRHSAAPGRLFRIPWVLWVREMMGGGYSILYLAACLANYLKKLETAVATKG